MAGLLLSGTAATIAMTASTTNTIMQIVAAAQHRVKVVSISISFNGITQADPPILVEVLRQTTAGTANALTLTKLCAADDETIQTTALKTFTSTEPTAGDILHSEYVHEQVNTPLTLPLGCISVIGGTRLAVRITPGTLTATTKAACTIILEE